MNFQYSSDECFIRYDAAQDEFIDAFNIDKMSSLLEKMNRLFNDDNRGLKVTDYTAAFNTCRVLIRTAYVGSCVNHRDMADTFTPIPYPKYDEAQDGYRSMLTGSVLMLGIPVTVASAENAGLVIEALSEHSAGELNDATYERVLSYQTMRTEDALDILKVIHKSLIVDFGYLTLKGSGQQLRWVVGDLVKAKSTDVASFHAKYEDAVMKFYDDLLTKYEKLN
jgi:hypothetical protein